MSGWLSRGETDGSFSAGGVILHHDGMGLPNDNVPSYMSQNGIDGAQLWVKRDGCVWFLAAGRKWHAGTGSGWRSIPANRGNDVCVGIETDHTFGQSWTSAMNHSIVVLTQEICAEYDIDCAQWCCGHLEYAPGRKPDPESFDLNAWRAAVKTGKTPDVGADDMSAADVAAINARLDNFSARLEQIPVSVWTKGITGEAGGQHANELLAAIRAGVAQAIGTLAQQLVLAQNPQGARFGVVVDDSTGAWYAVAPGSFWHLPSMEYVQDGRASGLLDSDEHHTNSAGIARIRETALAGAGVPYVKAQTYTVVGGDTLSKIAQACAVRVTDLVRWNELASADAITVGQVLKLSGE